MMFYTKVAGVTFEDRQRIIRNLYRGEELEPGTELTLRREPNNPFDSNAVAVLVPDGRQIGFLPRDCAQNVSQNMSRGIQYRAVVSAVTGGDADFNYGVNIQLTY